MTRPRSTALACAIVSGLLVCTPRTASAAASGSLSAGPGNMSGPHNVATGDWVSVGYDFQLTGSHRAAQFYVENAVAHIHLGCGNTASLWTLDISMSQGPYTVSASNNNWMPTDQQSSPWTYQGSARIPASDRCSGTGGQGLQVVNNGVSFTATLASDDTVDQVQAQFHAVDANANGNSGNVNCADASTGQNPVGNSNGQGINACSGGWVGPQPQKITAAQYVAPPPPPAPPSPAAATSPPLTFALPPPSGPSTSETIATPPTTAAATDIPTPSPTMATDSPATADATPVPVVPLIAGAAGLPGRQGQGVTVAMSTWLMLYAPVVALVLLALGVLFFLARRRRRHDDSRARWVAPPAP